MPDRWLSYADAGALFGLSPEAMRKRARRLRWRTQPGNDGRTLVLVPDDTELHPGGRPGGDRGDVQPDGRADVRALEALLAASTADLAAARKELETAREAVVVEREKAARAEGEAAALREALQHARGKEERLEAELAAARAELAGWTAGGPLARAARAFLNRRGRG